MSARDPAGQLLRALRRSTAGAGCAVEVEFEAMAPWASATFVGAHYRVRVAGDALSGWLSALPDAELPLRGCFVADCAVEPVPGGAVLSILVLEE